MQQNLKGKRVLLTGASGGIGQQLTQRLAQEGARLALVAYPGVDLPLLSMATAVSGQPAVHLVSDLRVPSEWPRIADWCIAELGGVDVLINNAGIEFTRPFHELPESAVAEVLRVNLEAPMMLTHALLPSMLAQGTGHVVNMSSLAGCAGPALQEPYAATKAALRGFTASLRASYRGSGVSASVICPGFVEAGIYPRICAAAGRSAPRLLGAIPVDRVCDAVLRAIQTDAPEIIVSKFPVRPILALTALAPRCGEWLANRLGGNDFFRAAASAADAKKPRPSDGSTNVGNSSAC
ncbi:MAG: SDR family NAD(P)-dependent oxidoreductase [Limisphaerales bacterium]|jgi:short-subunit dehydrogenase